MKYKRSLLMVGSLLMGISYFLPWVTFGDILSGHDLANLFERAHDNGAYLRFVSAPKIAVGILLLYFTHAPRTFMYYLPPILSLVPITLIDKDILNYQTIHYGFYLLHLAVILIWVGAFSYRNQTIKNKGTNLIWKDLFDL